MSETKRHPTSLWDHLALILKWKRLFVVGLTIALVLSVTYAMLAKKWYMSNAVILPPPEQQGIGALSSLIPNMDLGFTGPLGMSSEIQLLLTIMDSRRTKDAVIDHFNWMKKYEYRYRLDAYDRYIDKVRYEVNEYGALVVVVLEESPQSAAETVNYIVEYISKEFLRITAEQARTERIFVERRLIQAREDIAALEDSLRDFQRETGAVSVQEQFVANVQVVGKTMAELILAEAELEVARKTLPPTSSQVLRAGEKVRILQEQVDKLTIHGEAEGPSMLIGLDTAPEAAVRQAYLERQLELHATILEYLLPQYEQAKLMEVREEDNLYVLDAGIPPEKKHSPRRAFIVIGSMLLAFFFLYLYVIFAEWMAKTKEIDPDRYEMISSVLRGFTPKHLFRWGEGLPGRKE
ncbi:hypothetical protein GF324_03165 [bacterium]|nr:hypothetical protein [bacterium]